MSGIIPLSENGGVLVASLPPPIGVTNVYLPPPAYVSCQLNYYGGDCTMSRYDPQQINAFQSELLELAVKWEPNGVWSCDVMGNLARAFDFWEGNLPALIDSSIPVASGIVQGKVSLAIQADYPAEYNASNDTKAATPAFVKAAIDALVTPVYTADVKDAFGVHLFYGA